jgi:lipid-binding SYLF domain-containing protein
MYRTHRQSSRRAGRLIVEPFLPPRRAPGAHAPVMAATRSFSGLSHPKNSRPQGDQQMISTRRHLATAALGLCLVLGPGAALASDAGEAQAIVDKARGSLRGFVADKDYAALPAMLRQARAVVIFPQVLKAGFFLGGSGGTGVLLVRDAKTGDFGQPAFYTMGSVSFGLQFGGSAAEVVMLINTQQALDSMLTNKLKLGGEASVAAGPRGAAAGATVSADFVSFARAKGAFLGMSVEGSVLDVRQSLNQAYYGKPVTPSDILISRSVSNKGSASLRAALKAAAK